jgi:hypothetical protein
MRSVSTTCTLLFEVVVFPGPGLGWIFLASNNSSLMQPTIHSAMKIPTKTMIAFTQELYSGKTKKLRISITHQCNHALKLLHVCFPLLLRLKDIPRCRLVLKIKLVLPDHDPLLLFKQAQKSGDLRVVGRGFGLAAHRCMFLAYTSVPLENSSEVHLDEPITMSAAKVLLRCICSQSVPEDLSWGKYSDMLLPGVSERAYLKDLRSL